MTLKTFPSASTSSEKFPSTHTEEKVREDSEDVAERDLKTLALKAGVIRPQVKQCRQPPEAGRGKDRFSRRGSGGSTVLQHLDFLPVN